MLRALEAHGNPGLQPRHVVRHLRRRTWSGGTKVKRVREDLPPAWPIGSFRVSIGTTWNEDGARRWSGPYEREIGVTPGGFVVLWDDTADGVSIETSPRENATELLSKALIAIAKRHGVNLGEVPDPPPRWL